MEDNKKIENVCISLEKNILKRWNSLAKTIGVDLNDLIQLSMKKYEENIYSNIPRIKSKESKSNIFQGPKVNNKKRGRPPKSEKKPKKIEKKPQKLSKVDKRKSKLEMKKCPVCGELFESRGMGSHLRKCSRENSKKDNAMVITKEKMARLRQYKRFEDVGIHGREDYDIPSQILVKGNNGE